MVEFTNTLKNIATDVKTIAVPLAGLILIIIGLAYMATGDAQKKGTLKDWMVRVAIGFALVFLAASLVTWFSGKIAGGA